ncbi:unnamed protein product, partial [marine sediment metagenome]
MAIELLTKYDDSPAQSHDGIYQTIRLAQTFYYSSGLGYQC